MESLDIMSEFLSLNHRIEYFLREQTSTAMFRKGASIHK